jgi:hypothetical protein
MKLPAPFIQLPISFDAAALAREISQVEEAHWRPHPGGMPGNSALTLITTDGDPDSDEVAGRMRPTPWLLRLPYLMQVLEALGATWGRSRLMRLSGQSEVSAHVDVNYYWRERMRVHVPIITTPSVRFHCGGSDINMAAGECWIFDTWRPHRVLNEGDDTRIHLVADTVGGERFWDLLSQGRTPEQREPEWQPRRVDPRLDSDIPALDFESFNVPVVMSPWELREHIAFLLNDAEHGPQLAPIQIALQRFARCWHALWSCHGTDPEGFPRYRELLERTQQELIGKGIGQIPLRNGGRLMQALNAHVFTVALNGPKGVPATALRSDHDGAFSTAPTLQSVAPVRP